MKKVFAFVLTAAVLLSLAACSTAAKTDRVDETPAAEQTQTDNTQIPNPWTDYDSLDEAIAAAGFDCTIPDAIDGCSEKAFRVLDADGETMLEVIYADGETEIARVRKAPGTEDISGDYNTYDAQDIAVGDMSVTMKSADGLVKLAIWQDGGYTYAVSVEAGLSADAMAELVSQIG